MWLATRLLSRERGGYRMPQASKGAGGKRGLARQRGRKRPPDAAFGEDSAARRVGSRVVTVCCRSRLAGFLAQRSGWPHLNRFGLIRGRAPSSRSTNARTCVRPGANGIPRRFEAETSRDRKVEPTRTAYAAVSERWKASRVALVAHSSRGSCRSDLGRNRGTSHGESRARSCEATGTSEVR